MILTQKLFYENFNIDEVLYFTGKMPTILWTIVFDSHQRNCNI